MSSSDNFNLSPIKLSDYGINTTVVRLIIKYRMKDNDNKHKIWFIMDSNLILPEYFVEFDYIMNTDFKAEYLLVESSIRNFLN